MTNPVQSLPPDAVMKLLPVPDNVSMVKMVERYWPTIIQAIFDGFPLEVHLEFVEKSLTDRETLVSQGALNLAFDWAGDVGEGRKKQAQNLTWIPTHQATRQAHIDFWRSVSESMWEYSEKLAVSGMNLIIGFHGAVALGSIKVLSEKNTTTPLATEAAFVALPCALFGIALFAIGKLIAFHIASRLSANLKAKLINPKNSDFAELGKMVKNTAKPNSWAMGLIYGSMFWFLAYSAAIALILSE